jgi:hypothetical protein
VQVVEAADEEQVGDLLDHLQRVRDAAGPEGVPDAVDLVLDVAGDHLSVLIRAQLPTNLAPLRFRGGKLCQSVSVPNAHSVRRCHAAYQ